MATRNPGTFGGSQALFPACDRTPAQKLARVQRWLEADQEWLAEAQGKGDTEAEARARRSLSEMKARVAVLDLAIRTGRDVIERGRNLVIVESVAA